MALNATMRAVLWSGIPFNVTVQDVPRPQINNSNDALVRMTAAAICGTDLHIYHGPYGSLSVPYILGHEGVGVVEDIGDGVQTLSRGQHVVVPDVYDTGAINMMTGEPEAQLGNGPGLGLDYGSYYGCQAEYIVVPYADHSIIPIPESNVSDTSYLYLSDIFATGWAALTYSGFQAGDSVAVFGAGPVGLLSAHSAFIRGASSVYVVDSIPSRLALGESIGAIPISLNGTSSVVDQIMTYEPEGVTRSVDCVGYEAENAQLERQSNAVILDMIAVTGFRGGIGSVGVYTNPQTSTGTPLANSTTPRIEFPIVDFFEKGLTYQAGPVDVKRFAPYLAELIASGVAQPDFIVSATIGIEDAPEYYERFSNRLESKVIIAFD